MSTGVAEIDAAHQTLIAWINKLEDAMMQRNGKAEVVRILDFLASYATQHFAHEEGCMHQYRCPAAQANKRAHSEFLAHFTKMRAECERDGISSAKVIALYQVLGDWLRQHILRVDVSLKPCVKAPSAPRAGAPR